MKKKKQCSYICKSTATHQTN